MSKTRLLLATAIAVAVVGGSGWSQEPSAGKGVGEIGRYQLVASFDGHIYLLDTASGQVWSRTPGGGWRDEGNPVPGRSRRQVATLRLPKNSVALTVLQREERAIPGSDGAIRIRLGDITEGQVLLEVLGADGEHLVERTSVKQGDKVKFDVGKKKYVLWVTELRNILIGDDFAKLIVAEETDETSPDERRSGESEP